MLHKEVATLEDVLGAHRADLGCDYAAYRNHAYRVFNLCAALTANDAERLEKIAVAVAFHDLGIWTDRTFDYLKPSMELADAYLVRAGKLGWRDEIATMILLHHKITGTGAQPGVLVEPFRRADWIDVSRGALKFGLSRERVSGIFSEWPNNGFHAKFVRLELRRLYTHPWNPLPMVKL